MILLSYCFSSLVACADTKKRFIKNCERRKRYICFILSSFCKNKTYFVRLSGLMVMAVINSMNMQRNDVTGQAGNS